MDALLKQKQQAYKAGWMKQISDLEALKLKLSEQDQELLDNILAELARLVESATANVTLAPDSGM
jgi:hypothetical protein